MINSSRCIVHKIAWVLILVGALNWGLVGFFNFNLVQLVFGGAGFGASDIPVRVVYALVGISALISLTCGKCKMCKAEKR